MIALVTLLNVDYGVNTLGPASEHVLLAKQPIYNKDRSLYGYELLFRRPLNLSAVDVGEDIATSEVLVNYSTSISQEIDKQGHPLFINVSESFLLSEAFLPIDHSYVVIELLERIQMSDALVAAVHAWHERGYRFALDDYDFSPQWDPLLPYVSYLKVDILDTDLTTLPEHKQRLDGIGDFQWVAERIEDEETLNHCLDLGFDLFQGYVLARPKEILGNTIRASSVVTAEIIQKADQPDVSIDEIADLVSRDPRLTMQLLKLINSSLFSLPREISSLQQAITFLGLNTLKQWAMMIAFVAESSAPIECSRIILTRAKCCEQYFNSSKEYAGQASTAFLAGLISGVDVLLQVEPRTFIETMQFSDQIRQAVLNHQGTIGEVIEAVRNIEFCLTQGAEPLAQLNPVLLGHFAQAQRWAGEVVDMLKNT